MNGERCVFFDDVNVRVGHAGTPRNDRGGTRRFSFTGILPRGV